MNIRNIKYLPILKTKVAELKGLKNSRIINNANFLPIFEITKSRRSKKNIIGAVEKTIDDLCSLYDGKFIADLCSHNSQTNVQIEELLNPRDGFKNWINFVRDVLPNNAIPVVNITDPFDPESFKKQLKYLAESDETICIRVPSNYKYIQELARTYDGYDILFNSILVFDCGYISQSQWENSAIELANIVMNLNLINFDLIAISSSSYPMSVVSTGYGQDSYGKFRLLEKDFYDLVSRSLDFKAVYSDYALIHPEEYQGTVTNWVPRIDFPLDRELFYHRYRREHGGYELCASKVYQDIDYENISSWGNENIERTMTGNPIGKSPSHWISVRVNLHLDRMNDLI